MDVITQKQMEVRKRHFDNLDEGVLLKALNRAIDEKNYVKSRNIAIMGQNKFGWDVDYTYGEEDPYSKCSIDEPHHE